MTNPTIGKTEFSPAEIDDLRDRLKVHKESGGLSWTDLSKVTGVASGTLSAWVPGTYNSGNIYSNQDIPGRVARFFSSHAEQAALEATLPVEPDFLATTTSRRIMTALAMAQSGDMALVSTPPGIGKTASIRRYQATRGMVFVVTASPSTRGVNTMLIAVLGALGEGAAKGTPQAMSARVRSRMTGAGALLVIDEAQHLSAQALEELRSIHDETDCGVALVGDETLVALLKKYPQLYSRLGIRHSQPRALPEDIDAIAEAWGIGPGPERAYLREVGRKGGGLRTLTKTLRLAVRAARASGKGLTLDDLKDAFAQRFGEAV